MSRPARWAFSPLDYAAHLLLCAGDHPPGVLKARCGHLLPVAAGVHDHPTIPSVVFSFAVSLAIGLVDGGYPANRAAWRRPVDALRYE